MTDGTARTAGDRVIAGRYRLLSVLGEGGMGTVWQAEDDVLHREVALKAIRAPAGLPTGMVERLYTRLEREARAAARISNPNAVTVHDVVIHDGRPWIVMELIRGVALSDLLNAEGPLPPRRAAQVGAEVLAALRAAHAAGVLHRDVKPGNVLMANDGRVVLTDFGIAMVEGTSKLTLAGEVVGSPEFLAPERALGQSARPESDLWSLGVLLYAAVEGNSPFQRNTPLGTVRAVVEQELPPPRRADALAPVIEGLLRKDPAQRLDATRAAQELRVIAAGGPSQRRPPAASSYAPTPPRNLRAAAFLIAGLLALALALAGLTYALLNGGSAGSAGSAGSTGSAGGTDGTGSAVSAGSGPIAPTGVRATGAVAVFLPTGDVPRRNPVM